MLGDKVSVGMKCDWGQTGWSQINWLTLDSLNIFKLVLNQFQSRLKTIWLGGTDINDEGNFEWNDSNKSLVKNGYQRWTIGQPDNFDNEDCMEMLKNGYWNDQNCNLQRGRNVLCEKPIN